MESWRDYKTKVIADLYRIRGRFTWRTLLRELVLDDTFPFLFWWRTCGFLRGIRVLKHSVYPFARLILRHYKYRRGISIPVGTDIGPGLYLSHFGGIVINGRARIGANCNIGHGVTIGQSNRGKRKGTPVIGDRVFIGPGAVVIGRITIGDEACIGANAVVTKDIPPRAVVVGNPGTVVSYRGSDGYVNQVFELPHGDRADPNKKADQ